jgi:hypothetical protein
MACDMPHVQAPYVVVVIAVNSVSNDWSAATACGVLRITSLTLLSRPRGPSSRSCGTPHMDTCMCRHNCRVPPPPHAPHWDLTCAVPMSLVCSKDLRLGSKGAWGGGCTSLRQGGTTASDQAPDRKAGSPATSGGYCRTIPWRCKHCQWCSKCEQVTCMTCVEGTAAAACALPLTGLGWLTYT